MLSLVLVSEAIFLFILFFASRRNICKLTSFVVRFVRVLMYYFMCVSITVLRYYSVPSFFVGYRHFVCRPVFCNNWMLLTFMLLFTFGLVLYRAFLLASLEFWSLGLLMGSGDSLCIPSSVWSASCRRPAKIEPNFLPLLLVYICCSSSAWPSYFKSSLIFSVKHFLSVQTYLSGSTHGEGTHPFF